MATFAPPYIYKPTPNRKPASKQTSSVDKPQCSKLSGAALSMARLAAADSGGNELGTQETGTVCDGHGNDDDCDLPSIEQLLYTKLQKEGLATEDQRPKNSAFKVGDAAVERGGSLDDNGSALGDNSGGSLGDPIVLLGGDDSSASEAEADDSGPRAERVVTDEGLPDSLETVTDWTTPAPPNPDGWHDIDDFLKSAQNLQHSEQKPSTSDSMHPHTSSSSRVSSEPLHNHTSAAGQCTIRARSEATMCSSARRHQPSLCARASQENQPVHEDHLHTGRSPADEHELEVLGSTLDTDPVNEGKSQQQELEQRDDGPQQGVNDLAAVVTTESVDDTHPSDEDGSPRLALSPPCDPLPKSSHDEAGGRGDSDSDNDKADPEDDNKEPHSMKRKRPSSSHDGPMQKKRKRYPKQKSTRQHRPHSKLHRHSPPDQASRVTAVSSAEGRLPSPAPSAPQIMDIEMPSDRSDPGGSSSDFLPVLTEVTFRPYSQRCCSFTAVVREGCDGQGVSFSQLAQLIESIGHVGKIDDFTIKPLQQHSFFLAGFSWHASSKPSFGGATLSTAAGAGRNHVDAPRTRPQDGRTVDAGALASRSEPSNSDDDGGLSDSDPESSNDDDGCLSGDVQGRSSTSKHSRWDDIDEQRLLAYKKEDKSWDWIFKNFPGRTPAAVRTRWTMVQRKVK